MNQRKSYLFGLRHQMSDINYVIITHVAIDTFIPGYIQIYMYIYMYIYVYIYINYILDLNIQAYISNKM